jgi:hypothetical protein
MIAKIESPLDLLAQARKKPRKSQQNARKPSEETTSTEQPPA